MAKEITEESNVRQRKVQTPSQTIKSSKTRRAEPQQRVDNCFAFSLAFVAFFILLVTLPFAVGIILLMDGKIQALPIELRDLPERTGILADNNILVKSTVLFQDKIYGPESIVSSKGFIYTGAGDGAVYKLDTKTNTAHKLVSFGEQPCTGPETEPMCGRPLGMRMDANGHLVVMDAYLGLFRVNPDSGEYTRYFSSDLLIDGETTSFFNDLDIAPDGMIYITISSMKWQWRTLFYMILEGEASGRLMQYNPKTNSTKILSRNFHFANGVQVSRDGSYLLVAESINARIYKYHLKGEKEGKLEVFADNLPGVPDNIRLCSDGGYWVALAACRTPGLLGYDTLAHSRLLRNNLAKFLPLRTIASLITPCTLAVQVSETGEILRVLQDSTGQVAQAISEVNDDNGLLTFASSKANYITQLNTRKNL